MGEEYEHEFREHMSVANQKLQLASRAQHHEERRQSIASAERSLESAKVRDPNPARPA